MLIFSIYSSYKRAENCVNKCFPQTRAPNFQLLVLIRRRIKTHTQKLM